MLDVPVDLAVQQVDCASDIVQVFLLRGHFFLNNLHSLPIPIIIEFKGSYSLNVLKSCQSFLENAEKEHFVLREIVLCGLIRQRLQHQVNVDMLVERRLVVYRK